jgi:hypothetical protein
MFDETNAPAVNAPNTPAPDPKAPEPISTAHQPPPPAPAPVVQPAAQPAKPAPVQEDQTPGHFFKRISHSFAGALIGALAGQDPVTYKTDESGNMTAVKIPQTNRSRLQRIALHALEGLSAGAQAPRRQGAEALSGLGAGFAAQQAKAQQQDLVARQQEKESFDEQQKAMVQKYQNAHWNAQTAVEIANAKKLGEEAMQSHYKDTQDLMAGAREGDLDVSQHSVAEAEAIMAADKAAGSSSFVKHVVLGMLPPVPQAENGKPVLDAQGQPIMEKRLAIVTEDKKGNVVLSPSMVQRIQRVGKMAQISNAGAFQPGQPVPLDQFKNLFARVKSAENIVATKPPEVVQVDDGAGKKKWMKSNALGERSDLTAEENLAWQNKLLDSQKKGVDIQHIVAETRKENAEANKSNSEANQQRQLNPVGAEGLTGEEYLRTLPQGQQDVIKAIAEGRETRTPRQLQDKNGSPTPLAIALHRAYPDFDDKKASAYGGLVKDFTTGPTSRTLTSYGTAINHARALYDNTGPNSYIPGTDEHKRYNQDVTYVGTEVAKALNPTGVATESAIKEQEDALRSILNRKEAIRNAAHILSGKMSEIKQRWMNGQVRPSYQPPMPSLSKEALDNAEYLLSGGKTQTQDRTQQVPVGGTPILKNGQTVGYILNGKRVDF